MARPVNLAEGLGKRRRRRGEPLDPERILSSLQDDFIRCLECGRRFKALGTHLRLKHGAGADEYRARWGLKKTQGLVSEKFSEELRDRGARLAREGRIGPAIWKGLPTRARGRGAWPKSLQEMFVRSRKASRPAALAVGAELAHWKGSVGNRELREALGRELVMWARRKKHVGLAALRIEEPGLFWGAMGVWRGRGGARGALAECGVDIELRRMWTREKVIEEIRRRRANGVPVNFGSMQEGKWKDRGLMHGALTRFGTWRAALSAAGIDARDVYRGGAFKWTEERITRHIRKIVESTGSSVYRPDLFPGGFRNAAAKHFGSWPNAIRAAGIEPCGGGRSHSWSRPGVLEAVRARRKAGLSMRAKDVEREDHCLYQAAVRYFHGWYPARAEAGVPWNAGVGRQT